MYIRKGNLPFTTLVFYIAQSKIIGHLQYWIFISLLITWFKPTAIMILS
jgi:hypothetical protein